MRSKTHILNVYSMSLLNHSLQDRVRSSKDRRTNILSILIVVCDLPLFGRENVQPLSKSHHKSLCYSYNTVVNHNNKNPHWWPAELDVFQSSLNLWGNMSECICVCLHLWTKMVKCMVCLPQNVSNKVLHDFACVFWDYSLNDWSTKGCSKVSLPTGSLQCRCNHTTNFAVLMVSTAIEFSLIAYFTLNL